MDFDRIAVVLGVWHDTLNMPELKDIHSAAMEELHEHQARYRDLPEAPSISPTVPIDPTHPEIQVEPQLNFNPTIRRI